MKSAVLFAVAAVLLTAEASRALHLTKGLEMHPTLPFEVTYVYTHASVGPGDVKERTMAVDIHIYVYIYIEMYLLY